ncbi:MarR family winged helix-turn-helix transcriptional regulator [Brachybacterium sacelli]|uniref:DNA-binding MarR family transcriptional regulator n=1 Tax=Brachybacterium sacelli TaxID=173364 RepID=A0ABS4WYL2_9MICO|nr:MarR family transcriptional regulator [Brachybacterium sacelli]MBP2381295.1 DNA-binding MarR family transcriptional regulator [Brachybacterium sacelli]
MDRETLDLHRSTLRALTGLMSQWSSLDFQRRITAQCGLTLDPVAVRALYGLGIAGGSARPRDLADELHLTRPSTSKLIARLAAAGLVERTSDAEDGRGAHIVLSADGHRTYEQLVDAGIGLLAEATGGWDEAEVRALSELLTRFTEGLQSGPRTTT